MVKTVHGLTEHTTYNYSTSRPCQLDISPIYNCWGYCPGTLPYSGIHITDLQVGNTHIKSTLFRSAIELQRFDFNIGYQNSSQSNGRQVHMPALSTLFAGWINIPVMRHLHGYPSVDCGIGLPSRLTRQHERPIKAFSYYRLERLQVMTQHQ